MRLFETGRSSYRSLHPAKVAFCELAASGNWHVVPKGTLVLGVEVLETLAGSFLGDGCRNLSYFPDNVQEFSELSTDTLVHIHGFAYKVTAKPSVAPVQQALRKLPLRASAAGDRRRD